jgi:hypothetical protein
MHRRDFVTELSSMLACTRTAFFHRLIGRALRREYSGRGAVGEVSCARAHARWKATSWLARSTTDNT